jgi:lipopolysaccharide/colanic/teichoic acid biosynthesis glycosyltransferase
MVKTNPYYYSWEKRFFDILFSLFLLVILFPLLLIIGLIVLFTSGFPIIFKQKRVGLNGKIFIIYKFRTMKKNAQLIKYKYKKLNEAPEPMFKIHNDPRFIGFGKIFSISGLDELPQLINIFKGEMSFVGPRPLPIKEARKLSIAWRSFREKVKPGVFSEWSLASERHSTLKKWQKLEKDTIVKSGKQQLVLIGKMIAYLLKKITKLYI